MMRFMELRDFIKTAVECSVYVAPTAAGLTWSEVAEVGKQVGYEEGEIRDAIRQALAANDVVQFGARLEPGEHLNPLWDQFHEVTDPDFRNLAAFEYIRKELRDIGRKLGAGHARIERNVLLERGIVQGITRHDLEVAIRVSMYTKHLIEADGVLKFAPGRETYALPSEQAAGQHRQHRYERANLKKLHPLVRDVVERRTDGRSGTVEALDAFAERLAMLGHGVFRSWWIQTVSELRRLDAALNPVASSVLAAALVEGSLTFVVKHAKQVGIGPMGSKTFDGAPPTWKIDALVSSAAAGGSSAILDEGTRQRAESLIRVRQRIHAGRMLVDYPTGVPDLRPEEARDAKQTLDLVVRKIMDWLDRHPSTT